METRDWTRYGKMALIVGLFVSFFSGASPIYIMGPVVVLALSGINPIFVIPVLVAAIVLLYAASVKAVRNNLVLMLELALLLISFVLLVVFWDRGVANVGKTFMIILSVINVLSQAIFLMLMYLFRRTGNPDYRYAANMMFFIAFVCYLFPVCILVDLTGPTSTLGSIEVVRANLV